MNVTKALAMRDTRNRWENGPLGREVLGQVVRAAWVAWAREQSNPKPSWLVPWEELGEADKEADRRIGEAVREFVWEQVVDGVYRLLSACLRFCGVEKNN